jgi:hypothetical protein
MILDKSRRVSQGSRRRGRSRTTTSTTAAATVAAAGEAVEEVVTEGRVGEAPDMSVNSEGEMDGGIFFITHSNDCVCGVREPGGHI